MLGWQFVEVPIPKPGKGELLVKVEAISVNPVDWRIQDGVAKHLLPRRFPFVPGTDVAGEVVTLGPAVSGFHPGDKVITYLHILVICSQPRSPNYTNPPMHALFSLPQHRSIVHNKCITCWSTFFFSKTLSIVNTFVTVAVSV